MEAYHIGKLRTLLSSHVPVACTVHCADVLIATAGYSCKNTVALWHLHGCKRPIELSGHDTPPASIVFSSRDAGFSLLLCAASDHALILWDVDNCLRGSKTGHDPVGLVIPIEGHTGPVQCVCFSVDCYYVLVCVGCFGLIYRVKDGRLDTTISGHTDSITCAIFTPHHHDNVITAAEDRTFMIWDISSSILVYQSSIISAHSFISITVNSSTGNIILGSADGRLRVYEMDNGHYQCLHEMDLAGKLVKLRAEKVLNDELMKQTHKCMTSVIDTNKVRQPSLTLEMVKHSLSVEQGAAILSLYCQPAVRADTEDDDTITFITPTASQLQLQKALKSSSHIWVSMHQSVAVVNLDTMEIIASWNLQDPILCINDIEHTHCIVPISYESCFCWNPVAKEVICVSGAFAQGCVSVLSFKRLSETLSKKEEDAISRDGGRLSVTASVPLCAESPLRAELVPKESKPVKKMTAPGHTNKKQHRVHDRPLTFHTKIKSSGYTAQSRHKMFVPDTTGVKHKPIQRSLTATHCVSYPTDGGVPNTLYHTTTLSAPINQMTFSGDGQSLSCGTVDKLAHILTMPPSSSKSKAFSGHGGSVTSVNWSEDSQWLMTCSTDKTARVWTNGRKDPILLINTVQHNFISDQERDKSNVPFNKDINHAQFFYMDKFILLTSANSLYLYKYNIDLSKPDEIQRYISNNKYKLVKEFPVEQTQSITAMSAINDFFSYLVLLGCSNKTLHVYDMNIGKCVTVFNDIHARQPHITRQNKGSKYTTLPSDTHDLFLTSAVADGIKLWDLRTHRCVKRYATHTCYSHPLGASFSPCGQYVASGSENKCAYLYDIKSSCTHKLTGHREVVSDVAFHPARPLLATASLSGDIKYFKPP
ncbi:WD repeat-containing protein 27-like isoform X2 [Dysidea avara]|uniref:WD repeat-containing protein 27-like isoform X2 n=1 Tax=Dysidea avara TaxID=196820 RepID=UPI00331A5A4F